MLLGFAATDGPAAPSTTVPVDRLFRANRRFNYGNGYRYMQRGLAWTGSLISL